MGKLSAALLCALLLAGCTNPGGNGGIASVNGSQPSVAASKRDDPAGFAHCMQEHGQTIQPPTGGGDWAFDPHPKDPPAGWDEAMRACQHFLPLMTMDTGPSVQEIEQLRAFAVCMRAHDVPITDPQTGGDRLGNMIIGGRFANVTRTQLEADPVYRAALEACKDMLPDSAKKTS